jgi:hypothetical protein
MRFLFIVISLFFCSFFVEGQEATKTTKNSDEVIREMVSSYKAESRGPYKDLRWFCKDGSTVAPQQRCPEPGGVQRARYKDEVVALSKSDHIFLGQILATTPYEDFWDEKSGHSRLKQYQIEVFLRANDNGWILRKAQFYRGAFQIEDEQAWGALFFQWLLESGSIAKDNFFLIRQSAKDIPHSEESNLALNIRAISKEIADQYPAFMDLRVKIHGQPEENDIQKVVFFQEENKAKLSPELNEKFTQLIKDMKAFYKPVNIQELSMYLKKLPKESPSAIMLSNFIRDYEKAEKAEEKCVLIATTSLSLRKKINDPMKSSARLALIDVSNKLESLINKEASAWELTTLKDLLRKIYTLSEAAAGFGYVEIWEWEQVSRSLKLPQKQNLSLPELNNYVDASKRMVEWCIATVRAVYQEEVNIFLAFEPLTSGFVDDKVRASILLGLGSNVSQLGDYYAAKAGFSNTIMGLKNQSSARGLNAGYAMGELVVSNQSPDELEVSNDKIYVFNRPPADLKPVAGIATVSEGNMVSHVQLLARNLGIPNAVISMENLQDLLAFNGENVFYAVSPQGTVILKKASEMNDEERALFVKKKRSEEKIRVPIESMELSNPTLLNLSSVNASFSGKICGPKAANLGQLKQLFPDNVVNGIVIPFSVFKAHIDQRMPGRDLSYWQFLNEIFSNADSLKSADKTDLEIENYVLGQLEILRNAIKLMPLMPSFKAQLNQLFIQIFGHEMGKTAVFIRSDTNMEDLKDFTGAGLNLTLFNVLDPELIFQGIKDVWASPYTERSYKWRQKFLLNPENVFPSILIIPSVNANSSGVLITKGVSNGELNDYTVAFNRGVGGAVEGQASETWLIKAEANPVLLSPSRELDYTSLPPTGGIEQLPTNFNTAILNNQKLKKLREMGNKLNEKLPTVDIMGPYDVELGFKEDKIWLFQVRPFVENKRAIASDYLQSISPKPPTSLMISINDKL